ncbi:Metal-sulfur cluster biosynthetic enzyme [Nocardioides terrae]|uniref:Metal-sulfur cluster biosynthetic enzyme n=2 Tax=Nocardioides terrae TaxID=574651 RepID=A0A1I1JRA5_9ACTN|nr:Metal-sulfur cluster biosynthetic enzyme [Nocardioides terrae]
MTEHDHQDHTGHDHGHDHAGHDHAGHDHAQPGGHTMTVTVAEGASLAVDDVTEAMKDVVDPELGINVVDLGLVYGVHIGETSDVVIDMTLTSAACPLTDLIQEQTNMALEGMVNDVAINWVWMPPWGPDKITPDGREQLRALGFNV